MLGIGATELVIIIAIALVLFGAPVLTFLMGYSLGRKASAPGPRDPAEPTRPEEHEQ